VFGGKFDFDVVMFGSGFEARGRDGGSVVG
jgi:hypothetical protein